MEVVGETFPPPQINQMLSQLCIYSILAIVVMMFVGENIFKNIDVPLGVRACKMLKDNFTGTMILVFVLNMAAQNLIATGAFEIMIDGNLVFSKIQTGKLPTIELLNDLIKQHGAESAAM
mmetsp:Transcript_12489/g.18639  ORF Transcript_12489/g.18639 Transcript_12489/m.18639 type:complete len:120 (+) Transcript_12489:118-477(+)